MRQWSWAAVDVVPKALPKEANARAACAVSQGEFEFLDKNGDGSLTATERAGGALRPHLAPDFALQRRRPASRDNADQRAIVVKV